MFDSIPIHQASFFLYLLSLVTSLITLFSLGHVTTLALKLREQYIAANANEKAQLGLGLSMIEASEEGYRPPSPSANKWRLTGGGGNHNADDDGLPISMNCVNMRLVNIALSATLEQKLRPVRTPPPSPGVPMSPVPTQQMFYQPRPLSMAKLIMSRHYQRKPSRRSVSLGSPPRSPPATSLRHASHTGVVVPPVS